MNKRQKALLILLTPFLLGFLLGFLVGGGCSRKEKAPKKEKTTVVTDSLSTDLPSEDDVDGTGESSAREIIYYTKLMSYGQVFNDVNDVHVEKAKAVGLRKIPDKRDDIDFTRLVKVEDSDYLVIDDLRYSVPYLTKAAAAELDRIARAFHDSLTRKQFPVYKLVCSDIDLEQVELL